jgi:hypothetical protein
VRLRLLALTFVALTATVVAACGVPESSEFRPLGADDVADLQATTTTTTTIPTTTAPPTTLAPETTLTVIETTTTLVPTEPVDLYYVSGEQLQPVPIALTLDPTPEQVLQALVSKLGELGPIATGLRSTIPAEAQFNVSVSEGVAYVDMTSASLTTVAADGRFEFGQIVLSLLNNVKGIGQVKFSVDGTARAIERGDGSQIDAGGAASRDDYADLVAR